jgi:hypothetical protein
MKFGREIYEIRPRISRISAVDLDSFIMTVLYR